MTLNKNLKNLNIILIDDDKVDCELVSRKLKKSVFDYHLRIFHNGEHAIEYLSEQVKRAYPSDAYFIILDINVPPLDGFQILDRLQCLRDNILFQICILTTSDNYKDRQKAITMGIENYFLKQEIGHTTDLFHTLLSDFNRRISTY